MRGVELVMSDPGSHDLPVSRIFTHDMFLDLRQELADQVFHPPTFPVLNSTNLPRCLAHARAAWTPEVFYAC
jgi:hypothetical protein